jgi:hypothetical protein
MSSGQLVATEIKEKLPRDVENCIQVIQFEIKRKQKDMAVVMAKT